MKTRALMKFWVLVGHTPIECEMLEWAQTTPVVVAHTDIKGKKTMISTAFLGIDHGFDYDPDALPVLFETMVFSKDWTAIDGYTRRWRSWDEAIAGHDRILARIISGKPLP